jgi:uncharacterized membrane protein YtjA (UPF0391 family)
MAADAAIASAKAVSLFMVFMVVSCIPGLFGNCGFGPHRLSAGAGIAPVVGKPRL